MIIITIPTERLKAIEAEIGPDWEDKLRDHTSKLTAMAKNFYLPVELLELEEPTNSRWAQVVGPFSTIFPEGENTTLFKEAFNRWAFGSASIVLLVFHEGSREPERRALEKGPDHNNPLSKYSFEVDPHAVLP